jgi:CubicO group peptidase (beta-lactamase class C family)
MDASGTPGMSVAVAVRGDVVWSEAFGYADVEQEVRATPQTRFRVGSVSKLLTAAALVKLAENGALGLDEPVRRYVPSFTAGGDGVTSRRLAGHLGGIRHYTAADFAPGRNIDQTVYRTTNDALAIFQRDTLEAAPGTRYRYSTFSYTLLSAAIEGAAREEFLTALQRLVLTPLGMASTSPDRWDAPVPRRTRFYARAAPGEVVHDQPVYSTYKWAGGGMLSTAEDLARFGSAHLAPGFFKEESLRELFSSQRLPGGAATHVGLGWRIAEDPDGRPVYHHAGSIEGGRSILLVYPRERVVVALLSNRASSPESPELMAHVLAKPFLSSRHSAQRSRWMRTPDALRARGTAMPDSVRIVPLGGDASAVASPAGVHMLRGEGGLVWALQGPSLQPARN